MDKYEYKVRSDEIIRLIDEEKYEEAIAIADTIDWRRVKSITMLLRIATLYRVGRRNEDSRAVLMLAYERYPGNRSAVYSLCEVSIELDDVVAAIEYYKEFVRIAPRDNGVFTLRYRILEAQEASLEERIELLEELKKRDYQEEWAYELAYLYHRVGLSTKCVEECDDLILWFGDGPYVMKAMELKMLHAPLTVIQEKKYQMMQNDLQGIPQEEGYADDGYEQEPTYYGDDYAQEQYTQAQYAQEEYEDGEYTQEQYAQDYPQQEYEADEYSQDRYPEERYPVEGLSEETLSYDQEYQGQDTYAEDSLEQQEDNSQESAYVGDAYRENSYADMSQYNTINLQKVVAESMRELFPDDEDIYAENRKEVEKIENSSAGIYMEDRNQEAEQAESMPEVQREKPYYEGHVTSMIEGVTEALPEPQSGAVKRVILPGADARGLLKNTASDKEEINEQTAWQEKSELLYEDEEIQEEKAPFRPMTGQMNIQDVLSEWERMKKENEEKRKEEVRQLVLQQTGQLFENFDQSINTGILGQVKEEEKNIETGSQMHTEVFLEDTEEVEELEDIEELEDVDETVYKEEETLMGEEQVFGPEDILSEEIADYEPEQELFEEKQDYEPEGELLEKDLSEEVSDYQPEEEGFEEASDYQPEEEGFEEASDYQPEEEGFEEASDYQPEEDLSEEAKLLQEIDEYYPLEESEVSQQDTEEVGMNTEEISSLPGKIIAATKRETKGVKKEELREFTEEEQELFENYSVNKKVKKQIIYALDNMSLAAYTGNVIVTGEPGLGTIRVSKNLIREFKEMDANFSGKLAKISGKQFNMKNVKVVLEKLQNGALIIEEANGLTEKTLYEIATQLNREDLGIVLFMVDTKKGITKMLEKQTMIADYFNIRIDLVEMDNNALVAYAKSYAQALEYSIDDLGTLALYTRIANIQSGNHVVTKDEVRDIVDEAIWKSKKFKFKNFVDVLFSKRYDAEDMIVLKERDFI